MKNVNYVRAKKHKVARCQDDKIERKQRSKLTNAQ